MSDVSQEYVSLQNRCVSKSRSMKQCPQYTKEANGLCKIHQYQAEYTPEMMANLTPCSTCCKTFYLPAGKVCEGCKERAKYTREKIKETIILCDKQGCKFKKSTENKYCNKHQAQIFLDETAAAGLRPCYDHIRGCRSQLPPEYNFSKCQPCLIKDRANDNQKRNGAIQESKTFEGSNKMDKKCTVCCKEYESNVFIGQNGVITKTCANCRESNKRQDERRDKERRIELARVREQTLNIKYNRCIKTARTKEILFELTLEQYSELINQECYYCGLESSYTIEDVNEDLYKNGIDRKDSKIGYLYDNCVGCCQMCNYMKHSLSVNIFLKRIEHIIKYLLFEEVLYPEIFADYKNILYTNYKKSAKQRNLELAITSEEFYKEVEKNCYICGKQSIVDKHINGLDRVDNTKGYVIENIKSCCRECNFMKNTTSYDEFIDQCKQIYEYKFNKSIEDELIDPNRISSHTENIQIENTKENNCCIIKREHSVKEMREKNKLRKQKQIAALKEKYGDAAYKEMKAKQMADYRNKKKEEENNSL